MRRSLLAVAFGLVALGASAVTFEKGDHVCFVGNALGDRMQQAIHALSLQTFTPEEWDRQKPFVNLQ